MLFRKEFFLIVVCFVILLIPNILYIIYIDELFFKKLELLMISTIVLLVLLSLFKKSWFFLIITLPIALIIPLESFYISNYHSFITPHIMGIVFDTNISEIKDFTQGNEFKILFIYLVLLILWISGIIYSYRSQLIFNHFLRYVILLIFIPFLIYTATIHEPSFSDYGIYGTTEMEVKREHLPDGFYRFEKTLPLGIFVRIYEFNQQLNQFKQLLQRTQNFHFNAKREASFLQKTKEQPEIYVLVIGESSRYDKWQLNGYQKQTTPHLSKRQDIVSYENFYTQSNSSRESIPVMLTRKKASDKRFGFHEKSIIDAFNNLDFKTAWFSTQMTFGEFDTPISIHAKEAANLKYFNNSNYNSDGVYDEVLLKPFQQLIDSIKKPEKHFIVIHTLGSHFNYSHRYPENFDVFQPSVKNQPFNLHDKTQIEKIRNSYDNSILYTDFILNELLNIINNKKEAISWLIYVSDHGVDLFEDGVSSGQGRDSENVLHIPFIAWFSEHYKMLNPEITRAIFENKNKKYTTESIFYTLCDLAGIQINNNNGVSFAKKMEQQ
jgi:glucan phosphoethanolaminetransferase (alkaline phosphatase superfamily)